MRKNLEYLVCCPVSIKAHLSEFISKSHALYLDDFIELFCCFIKSLLITAIHNIYYCMSVGEIHLPILSLLCFYYLIEFCPPKSHTWNFKFLYSTTSILKPIVGTVCFTSFRCSLSI